MATVSVPRALMKDTSPDAKASGYDREIEKGQGYGTFVNIAEPKLVLGLWEEDRKGLAYENWNEWTTRLADSAPFPFLFLLIPQIILNCENLLSGDFGALSDIPWIFYSTGVLSCLSMLSYFGEKRERGAMATQSMGVLANLLVLMQLTIAGNLQTPVFAAIATVGFVGFFLNLLNYLHLLRPTIWLLWKETVVLGSVTGLPQIMWSTFEPYLPHSVLPAILGGVVATILVSLARWKSVPEKLLHLMGGLSAWSAIWGPVIQMWTFCMHPANLRGLSVSTVLLTIIGNGLLMPRALFTRDLVWFTTTAWGAGFSGWGILLKMYLNQDVNGVLFWGVFCSTALSLGNLFWIDSRAHDQPTPFSPLIELLCGSRLSDTTQALQNLPGVDLSEVCPQVYMVSTSGRNVV